jgi:hypothetical protein
MKSHLFLLAVLLGMAGCTSVNSSSENNTDLSPYRRIYVQTASNDNDQLDQLLARELVKLGLQSSAGVRTLMPDDTQAVITYEQQWNWEFGLNYLYRLEVSVRDVRTEELIGHGVITHPGLSKETPEQMVHAVLAPIFGRKK